MTASCIVAHNGPRNKPIVAFQTMAFSNSINITLCRKKTLLSSRRLLVQNLQLTPEKCVKSVQN